jgi:hypothetical protein
MSSIRHAGYLHSGKRAPNLGGLLAPPSDASEGGFPFDLKEFLLDASDQNGKAKS